MLRKLIKSGIASTMHHTGANGLLARRKDIKHIPLIIGYHRVVENYHEAVTHSIPPMLISSQTFERQVDWIGRRFEYIELDDVLAWTKGEKRFDRPVAAITFDDGYADLYHNAFPILRRKGVPSAVFVVSNHLGTNRLQINDELFLLLRKAYARWHQPRRTLIDLLKVLDMPEPIYKKLCATLSDDPLHSTWALIESLPRKEMNLVIDVLRNDIEIPEEVVRDLAALIGICCVR